jgi:hypothetical protein
MGMNWTGPPKIRVASSSVVGRRARPPGRARGHVVRVEQRRDEVHHDGVVVNDECELV